MVKHQVEVGNKTFCGRMVNGKAIVGVLLAVLLVGWTVVAWLNTHEMPEQPCGPAAYSCDWQPDGTFTVWQ